jgi:hypothetical protein
MKIRTYPFEFQRTFPLVRSILVLPITHLVVIGYMLCLYYLCKPTPKLCPGMSMRACGTFVGNVDGRKGANTG